MADSDRERRLEKKLASLGQRIQWLAEDEARSAWVKGLAAQGAYLDEKERLIDEADRILDELMRGNH